MPAWGPSVNRVDVPDDGPSAEAMRGMASRAVEVAADWGLELGVPYALSRYSFVAPAGPDAVLKITWELDDECLHEADALEVWAGDGAVRLLRRDVARRALLMERADPGTDISDVPDDEATAIAVDLGPRLWRVAGPPFLWNPIEAAMTPERTERRIAAFARAGLDEARIRAWTVIRGAYLGMAGDAETAEAIRLLVRYRNSPAFEPTAAAVPLNREPATLG